MQQKSNKKHLKGFTLVELIITITILAILSAISFISFQNYTKDTRDSVRLADITQIYKGLNIIRIQTEKTLTPDNYLEITNGNGILTYQGYAGKTTLKQIKITNGGQDPLSEKYYTYTTDTKNKKIQLMTYLETADKEVEILGKLENTITKANAETTNNGYYLDKKIYVYGDKIGIITDKNKVPLQETTTNTGVDITTTNQELKTYFGGEIYENGTSSKTGTTLSNQIEGAINGTVPCNPTSYSGYTITSLQDKETQTFTKPLVGITNGSGTGTIEATCKNGALSYTEKPNNISCAEGYVPNTQNTNCVENKCGGTFPDNAEENGTQELTGTWGYSENSGTCKFKCKEGYTYDLGNNTCNINKYTISGTITNGNGGIINLCGTSTNIDSSGNFTLSNIDYGTNCSGITISKDSYNCSISNDGAISLISDISNVSGSCSLQYLDVANSLRFNGTNQYLSMTPSSVGNRKTWTFSAWVKRTGLNTYDWIFGGGTTGGSAYVGLAFEPGNRLRIIDSNSPNMHKISTQTFIDTSIWYNIVAVIDTTDITPENRTKLYVNGLQITSWNTNTNYSTLNFLTNVSGIWKHSIGGMNTSDGYLDHYFDGYISEVNFIDGEALGPENFGVNIGGKWLPKTYTGNYGTNGFHLDFKDGTTQQNLGKDVSGKNNHWTVNNNQVTDQMLDSPTNNFATLDTTIVNTYKSGLTNGNLSNTYPGTSDQRNFQVFLPTSGKYYAEFKVSGVYGGNPTIGIMPVPYVTSGAMGTAGYQQDTHAVGYFSDGRKNLIGTYNSYGVSFGSSDTIATTIDIDNKKINFYVNNTPQGELSFTSLTGPFMLGNQIHGGVISTWNFGQGGQSGLNWCANAGGYFKNCPPDGFKALSSKNIGN